MALSGVRTGYYSESYTPFFLEDSPIRVPYSHLMYSRDDISRSLEWRHILFYASLIQTLDNGNEFLLLSPGTLTILSSILPSDGLPLFPRLRDLTWNQYLRQGPSFDRSASFDGAHDLLTLFNGSLRSLHIRIDFLAVPFKHHLPADDPYQLAEMWLMYVVDMGWDHMAALSQLEQLTLDGGRHSLEVPPSLLWNLQRIKHLTLRHITGMRTSS